MQEKNLGSIGLDPDQAVDEIEYQVFSDGEPVGWFTLEAMQQAYKHGSLKALDMVAGDYCTVVMFLGFHNYSTRIV